MSILNWLLNPTGLTPHGFCLSWSPGLVTLHAASDALIALAYFSIPLAIGAFARRRADLKFRWVAYLFVAFILACGSTHLLSIVTLWVPLYGIEGLVKAVTAVLSLATAAALWPLIPKLLVLPSAEALQVVNSDLSTSLATEARLTKLLRASERDLQSANLNLERRVADRTAELYEANKKLEAALAENIRTQAALAKSEEEFRVSFEAAAVGEALADPNTHRFLRVNRAFAEMLGCEPAEIEGRETWEFTHPDDRARDMALFAASLSGDGPPVVREKRYLRRDGDVVWGRISATVIRSLDDGTPTMTVSVIENIDERYKAQKALETAKTELESALVARTEAFDQASYREAMLKLILDTGPDAIIVSDAAGLISRFSPSAERIFGWSEAEMIGRHIGLIMPEQFSYQEDAQRGGRRAVAPESFGKSREVVGKRRDGSRFPMMLYMGELKIGGVGHVTEFVRDLTDVREATDRAQGLQAQLNQLWSLNSLGEMAAVLAHELNQPLTAIVNYVEGAHALLVRLELEDETILEAIEKASEQAIRAGEIIRRMRGIINKNESSRCLEDLRDIVTEVDFMVSLVSRESGVTVLYNLATDIADVFADRVQIQQVILNFVRNAVEAMLHNASRIVEITTRLEDGFWILGVEDSGPGISPDIAERLFLPMNSTKPQGMGLGLSLSKAIVENHGGAIWVTESRFGGAGFCFSLPVAQKT